MDQTHIFCNIVKRQKCQIFIVVRNFSSKYLYEKPNQNVTQLPNFYSIKEIEYKLPNSIFNLIN